MKPGFIHTSHFPFLTRYFTPSVSSMFSPFQQKASFLSNLPGEKKFVMKRLKMESSKIQVEVCHLGTRYGRKRFFMSSEQHSKLSMRSLTDFPKENCSRRISFLDQRIPPLKLFISCTHLYSSCWKTSPILHLKSLTTIID